MEDQTQIRSKKKQQKQIDFYLQSIKIHEADILMPDTSEIQDILEQISINKARRLEKADLKQQEKLKNMPRTSGRSQTQKSIIPIPIPQIPKKNDKIIISKPSIPATIKKNNKMKIQSDEEEELEFSAPQPKKIQNQRQSKNNKPKYIDELDDQDLDEEGLIDEDEDLEEEDENEDEDEEEGDDLEEDLGEDFEDFEEQQKIENLTQRQKLKLQGEKIHPSLLSLMDQPKKKRNIYISEEDQIQKLEKEEKRRKLMAQQNEDKRQKTVDSILNEDGRKKRMRKEREEQAENAKNNHIYKSLPAGDITIKYKTNKYETFLILNSKIDSNSLLKNEYNDNFQNIEIVSKPKCTVDECQNQSKYRLPKTNLFACGLKCYKILLDQDKIQN